VIKCEVDPMFHHREGEEQQLVHAGTNGLHFGEWAIRPLDQPIVVRTQAWVVLQAGDRGQEHDFSQSGSAAVRHV